MSVLWTVVRPHRFEVTGVAIFTALTFLVAGGLAVRLIAFGIPLACLAGDAGAACQGHRAEIPAYLETAGSWGTAALGTIALLPALSGLVLGIALVGKEIDQRTTTLAWALAPSRRRWLLLRVIPAAVAVVLASLAAGAIADELQLLRDPGVDPSRTFAHLGIRGPVVGAEALAFLGLALLVGSVLGRVLPALLLAGALAVASFVGITVLNEAWLGSETVLVYGVDGGLPGRVVEYMVQGPDGAVMRWADAYAHYGDAISQDSSGASFRTVLRVNPPELYPLVVDREAVLYSTIGLSAIVLSFAVIERRRP